MGLEIGHGVDYNNLQEESPELRFEVNSEIARIWAELGSDLNGLEKEEAFISKLKASEFIKKLIGKLAETHDIDFDRAAELYELFRIVDEDDNYKYYPESSEFQGIDISGMPILDFKVNCHPSDGEKKEGLSYFHRGVIWIITNSKGEVMISERTSKKLVKGGMYELGGGHCGLDNYFQALEREMKQELNIDIKEILAAEDIVELYDMSIDLKNKYERIKIFKIQIPDGVDIEFADGEVVSSDFYPLESVFEILEEQGKELMPAHKDALLKILGRENNKIFRYKEIMRRISQETFEVLKAQKL